MTENIERAIFLKQIRQRFVLPIVLILLLIFAVNFVYQAMTSGGTERFLLVLTAVILTLYYFVDSIKRPFAKLNQRITKMIPTRSLLITKKIVLIILLVFSTFLVVRMFMDWTFNWGDSLFFSFLILFELITRSRDKENNFT